VFVALAPAASLVGGLIHAWSRSCRLSPDRHHRDGLHFLGLTRIGLLMREGRLTAPKPVGYGRLCDGLAFAFGWTPCNRPDFGCDPSIAAAEATVTKVAGLLASIPPALEFPPAGGVHGEQFSSLFARMKRHLDSVERVMGVLMVITGIGFLTGAVSSVSIWLLETFPALQNIG